MIQLGTTQRDKITGFQGVVTGYVTYLTGCNQALLAAPIKRGGSSPESQWIDEQRLEPVRGKKKIVLDNRASPGFDKPAPVR